MGLPRARRSLAAARRAGQTGRRLIGLTLLASTIVLILIFWGLLLFTVAACGPVFEPIAGARNGNDLSMMKEPVQDRRSRGHIAEQFSPVFQGPVRGHDRGLSLVAPHDDFKEVLSRPFRQLLDAHVIDDQKIGLEVFGHHVLLASERLILQEVSDRIKDRAVANCKAALDGLIANRLNQMTFSCTRRP